MKELSRVFDIGAADYDQELIRSKLIHGEVGCFCPELNCFIMSLDLGFLPGESWRVKWEAKRVRLLDKRWW